MGTTASRAAEFKKDAEMDRAPGGHKNVNSRARKSMASVPRTEPIKGPDKGMG